ncbi:hypothetical protein [Cellulophaga sp. Hel_I_12]|uniref:hypothetical protein n=1 Tax=Cellulophaga sp. Hel_I_12 TaxID=1249972 RepID=UPI000645DBE7|nr:hypothetical protein [Cellulophaga sp. Hel_I_12]
MNDQTKVYNLNNSANSIIEIINSEIGRNNIAGGFSEDGGIEIYGNLSFFAFTPNLGPLVKLIANAVNTNENGTESKLTLKRINGITYKMQFWFGIFFVGLTLTIAVYQLAMNGFSKVEFLIMPTFGLIYSLIIELIARFKISSLIKTVEKLILTDKMTHKKL